MSRMRVAPRFVGRRQELEWLDACLDDAVLGVPQLVLMPGDAGIGKTRLLRELQDNARLQDMRVSYGRCYENLALPYLPLEELLTELARLPVGVVSESDRSWMTSLGGQSPSSPAPQALDAARELEGRMQLFLAAGHSLIALARQRPLLVLIDDLHWIDRPSLDLFAHLLFQISDLDQSEPLPLMLVASYRPLEPQTEVAHCVARFEREEMVRTLEVSGLDDDDVGELLAEVGLQRPARQLVDTVQTATRGNPLFVQQVARQLERSHQVETRSGYSTATVTPENLELPDDVISAVSAQIDELSETCRRVLTLASFLGDGFEFGDLLAVSDLDENPLLEALEEACGEHVLTNVDQRFEFSHSLMRHVAYRRSTAARRQRIHNAIAESLEERDADSAADRPLEIAHHLLAAGPVALPEKLARYGRLAGDRTRELFAWGDAARFYAAAAAGSHPLPSHERGELEFLAGHSFNRSMDPGPALEHYEHAIAAYREAGDVRGMATALMEKTRVHVTIAAVTYGTLADVKPLEDALTELGDTEPALRASILECLANVYWTARDPKRCEALATQSLEMARELDDPLLCSRASGVLALAQSQQLEIQESLESNQRSVDYARRAGDLWFEGQRLIRTPMALIWLGRVSESEPVAQEACELTRRAHNWGEYSLALTNLLVLDVIHGEFEAAESHIREIMEMIQRGHYPWAGPIALPALACARFLNDQWREAEDAVALLQEPGRVFDDPGTTYDATVRFHHRFIRAHVGEAEPEAPRRPDRSEARRRSGGLEIGSLFRLCAQIEMADLRGEAGAALQPAELLRAAANQGVLLTSGWVFLIPRVLGVAASLAHDWERGESYFQTGIDLARSEGARPELARSHLDLARMWLSRKASGDDGRALDALTRAHETFSELGMDAFAARAAALADPLGTTLASHESERATTAALSPAETQLLVRTVRGQSPEEIANALYVRPPTVTARIDALIETLGVRDHQGLAEVSVQRGLLTRRQARTASPGGTGLALPGPMIICFTDIAASTVLIRKLGDTKARELMRAHESVVRDCLREFGGSEIQHTGDGFMLSLPIAARAIDFAVAIQQRVSRISLDESWTLAVRVGMNAGEPIAEPGRLFGAAVNAAARICARAKPGEILISDVVRELSRGHAHKLKERGRFRLKGFSERFRLFQVQWHGKPI